MKIKENVELKEVAGEYIVLGGSNSSLNLSKLITLNSTGAFLFNLLKSDKTKEELLDVLLNKYDIDKETATNDINNFVNKLKDLDILIWVKN